MGDGFPDSRGFWGIIARGFGDIEVPGVFFRFEDNSGAKIGLIVALLIDRDGGIRGRVGLDEWERIRAWLCRFLHCGA